MTGEYQYAAAAPVATKAGAGVSVVSGFIPWLNQNLWIWSALGMLSGLIAVGVGIYFQYRSDKRKSQEHELHMKLIRKQLENGEGDDNESGIGPNY
jgi:hypothetical protein